MTIQTFYGCCIVAYCCLNVTAPAAGAQQIPVPIISEPELMRRTQALYDSLPSGDRRPWAAYYADDAMMYDEKGRSMNKAALLADLQAMPSGYSGSIKLVDPHAVFAAHTAILAYGIDEEEVVFGQELHARYHSVDTWLYRKGRWQIVISQTMRYYEDPAEGSTDIAHLDDFVGTYELAPGNRRTVSREGSNLYLQRGTGTKTKLIPETCDLFFRTGVEGRILFHRDALHSVDSLYDRRNNEDIVWRRVR